MLWWMKGDGMLSRLHVTFSILKMFCALIAILLFSNSTVILLVK
jgi:hypothetical protein